VTIRGNYFGDFSCDVDVVIWAVFWCRLFKVSSIRLVAQDSVPSCVQCGRHNMILDDDHDMHLNHMIEMDQAHLEQLIDVHVDEVDNDDDDVLVDHFLQEYRGRENCEGSSSSSLPTTQLPLVESATTDSVAGVTEASTVLSDSASAAPGERCARLRGQSCGSTAFGTLPQTSSYQDICGRRNRRLRVIIDLEPASATRFL